MVSFKVRADRLSEVASLIGTVVATFDSNLAEVDRAVGRTVNVTWVGDDADKFEENWATFQTIASQVRVALTQLQHGLIGADTAYSTTEAGIGKGFQDDAGAVLAVKGNAGGLGKRVATGEDRAEDIAEYFGRDYAGDDEVERFGGGALGVRSATGQATGGGSGDTDDDGDDDAIGTGPFLSAEHAAAIAQASAAAEVKGDGDV